MDAKGRQAVLCEHFGSAPYFTIYDSQTDTCETVNNTDHDHEHGTCHPMDNLKSKGIDCVACRGLGRRAFEKLNSSGIKVWRTGSSTVGQVVENLSAKELAEIDAENACQEHRCH